MGTARLSEWLLEVREGRFLSRLHISEVRLRWFMIAATLAVIGVHFMGLEAYPPVFIDEPWYSDVAWTYLQTGVPFDSMFQGALDQWDAYWIRWQVLAILPYAASFSLFGLGLLQARIVSWLFGILLLGGTMALGSKLYDKTTGVFAALLLSLSSPFLQASHYARPDIFLAVTVMAAFLLLLSGLANKRALLFFLSSLIAGLSVDVHTNGALFAIGLAAVFVFEQRKQLWSRTTLAFATGALLSAVYYVVVHVSPNPETYRILSSAWQGQTHLPPIATLDPMAILRSLIGEIGRYHFFEKGLDFALIGAGLLYIMLRRSIGDRRVLIYVGVTFGLFVLLVANKHDIYAILFYPYLLLVVANVLVCIIRTLENRWREQLFVGALAALFIISSVIQFARPILRNQDYRYEDVTDRIAENIPPGSRVIGLPNWWLGLANYEYRSIMSLTYLHLFNGYSLEEGLNVLEPDYIIVDTGLRGLLVEENAFSTEPGFDVYNLPRRQFETYLAERGQLMHEFVNMWHGRFQIYAIGR